MSATLKKLKGHIALDFLLVYQYFCFRAKSYIRAINGSAAVKFSGPE